MSEMDELAAMREWIAETARKLGTLMTLPAPGEIGALPDDRVREVVEQSYPGGLRLFRWTLRNGGDVMGAEVAR